MFNIDIVKRVNYYYISMEMVHFILNLLLEHRIFLNYFTLS